MSIEAEREIDAIVARDGGFWVQTGFGRVWVTKEIWDDQAGWRKMARAAMNRQGYQE